MNDAQIRALAAAIAAWLDRQRWLSVRTRTPAPATPRSQGGIMRRALTPELIQRYEKLDADARALLRGFAETFLHCTVEWISETEKRKREERSVVMRKQDHTVSVEPSTRIPKPQTALCCGSLFEKEKPNVQNNSSTN